MTAYWTASLRHYQSKTYSLGRRMNRHCSHHTTDPHQSPVRLLYFVACGIRFTIDLMFQVKYRIPTVAELSMCRRWLQCAQVLFSDLARSLSPAQLRADIEYTGRLVSVCAEVGELHLLPALLDGSGLDCRALQSNHRPYRLTLAEPRHHYVLLVGLFTLFRLGLDPTLVPSVGERISAIRVARQFVSRKEAVPVQAPPTPLIAAFAAALETRCDAAASNYPSFLNDFIVTQCERVCRC